MSYANGLAHLNPVAGIYSVIVPGLMYSLFGTCRQLSVGPEAALSLLVGQVITERLEADPHSHPDNPEEIANTLAGVTVMLVSVY